MSKSALSKPLVSARLFKSLLKHVVRIDTQRPGIVPRHPDVAPLSTYINPYRHLILFISP
ncbi:hypothetical protein [Gimesia maris]|uniref:hypothetical protein n=1 Tax=Gimesia maris TaxID=122 RepID=UPI0030D8D277